MKQSKSKLQQQREMLNSLTEDKNLISGIYNYCDRWCERCQFTDRCSVYKMEKEEGLTDNDDISMEDSLKRVSNIFALTMEMLHEMAEEVGIDLNNLDDIEIPKHIPGELEELATDYGKDVYKWVAKNREFFNQQIEMYFSIDEKVSKMINEVIQVISWYGPLLGAKTHRAMYKADYEEESDNNDNLGSAKIALISIERSIGAFSFILNNIPEKEDESLKFLATLTKIKRLLKDVYPDAISFKRPGFDD